ncbi:hypothetical protein J421_5430 (plasmid) [Gemmatirosa kalamazoonensis]|uniref:Lipoprotein n=1 Tax=Gemmatirosa kalamazoonensis TaxID=861299 RepID=W0RRL3_9BACT|nr:hypothetical protein [Gemmatirosa kalamazoonensis]AHG92965.1 hypothetical protein J421_5430 [Gemmatirosa kalamazoonensis]
MSITHRLLSLTAAVALVGATACSNDGPAAPALGAPSLSKSGTAASGGSGGGGGGDNSTSTTSGPPVAPSYTARIDSIGVVPTAMYYGTPSEWTIGGYRFEANSLTHLKAPEGPLVVGACVSVTFSVTYTGAYLASEIKTEQQSRCG